MSEDDTDIHSNVIPDWQLVQEASLREEVDLLNYSFIYNIIFKLHNQGSSDCVNTRKCLPES